MIGILRKFSTLSKNINIKPFRFSTKKQNVYIPIRTLKQETNLIFDSGDPQAGIKLMHKILIYTPFLAVSLDGFINQWTNWRIAGSVIFLFLGQKIIKSFVFRNAHQIFKLKVNKDLSQFYLTLNRNKYSQKIEQALLSYQNTTYQQKFKKYFKKKALDLSQEFYQGLLKMNDEQLENHIKSMKSFRTTIIVEMNSKDIQQIKFASIKQILIKIIYIQLFGIKDIENLIEKYSTQKQERKYLLITTKPIKDWNNRSINFLLNCQNNFETKYDQYLKALGEGKKIINI